MEERKKLIVGIDPGTSIGYAVIDLDGKFLQTGTLKEGSLDLLITKIISIGKVLIVGCDKAKVPDFVARFATKVGAKVICPDEDLLVDEKRMLTQHSAYGNTHEMDATASALFAWKNIEPLFKRVHTFLQKQNKESLFADVKITVLERRMSIASALAFVQQQPQPFSSKKTIEKKIVKKESLVRQKPFDARVEKLLCLKNEKQNLALQLSQTKKMLLQAQKKIVHLERTQTLDERITLKEKRIISLSAACQQKDSKIQELREHNSKLFQLLSRSKDHIIMPRLKNLGWQEFSHRTQRFPIHDHDLVFVDDPYSFSQQTLDVVRAKNLTLLSPQEPQRNTLSTLGIAVLNVHDVPVELHPTLVVLKKADLDRKRKESFWMRDIVEEYREERKEQLGTK